MKSSMAALLLALVALVALAFQRDSLGLLISTNLFVCASLICTAIEKSAKPDQN